MQAQMQRAGLFKQLCSASLTTMSSALAACSWPKGRMAAKTATRDAGFAGHVGRPTTRRSKKPGSNPGGQQRHPGGLSQAKGSGGADAKFLPDTDLTECQETCVQHVQEHVSKTIRQPRSIAGT